MDLPFRITFYQNNKEMSVKRYTHSHTEVYQLSNGEVIEITENLDTDISFTCSSSQAKLYMDGLEVLPEEYVGEDEKGGVYLEPSETKHTIYKNIDSNSFFPLIPGFYQLCVICNGQKYFSLFRIRTKQITEEQWENMRNEIEELLSGLSQDLVKKNLNVINKKDDNALPNFILRKWHLINQFKKKLISSIQDLTMRPRHEVKKKYSIVPVTHSKSSDIETIKFMSQHPEKKDFHKTPYREVDFLLPENKLLKSNLLFIDKTLKETKSYSEYYEDITRRKILSEKRSSFGKNNSKIRSLEITLEEIIEIKKESKKLIASIQYFLNDSWLKEVPSVKNHNIPFSVTMDKRYLIIFKLYKKLKDDRIAISFDPIYQYNWKRTDLLYELWSFINVVKAFSSEELGFSPVSGWLIDDYPNVPELLPGDMVIMEKSDIKIQIVYEGEVLGTNNETSLEYPLYTGSENRTPDCRIDYYDSKGYIGSLILDFKYRPVKSIWNTYLIRNRGMNKVMKQLNNYRNSLKSRWFYKDRIDLLLLDQMLPIREVWGVYPLQENENVIRKLNDYQIRLIDLTPMSDNHHFTNQLKEITDKVIQLSKRY